MGRTKLKSAEVTDTKPWYKQVWPWFIISLPLSSVIAGLSTLYIAINTDDTLVKDDWYKQGKAINRRFELDQNASTLGISANLRLDQITGEALLDLSYLDGDYSPTKHLSLQLVHSTLAKWDQEILLTRNDTQQYRGNLLNPPKGKFHVVINNLSPASLTSNNEKSDNLDTIPSKQTWRVSKIIHFPVENGIKLGG